MEKIPTTVITGFLGCGKTTLLNHIIMSADSEKLAIIINEFGEVGIDGQLVVGADEEILELNNGCICCTVRGDLTKAIANITASDRAVDRIIIETTGLADPAPIIQSFILDEVLVKKTRLDAVITVVDALYIDQQLDNEQAREQAAFADVIVLNKTDLVSSGTVIDINRRLRSLNPFAPIYCATNAGVSSGKLLDIRAFDLRNALRIDPLLLSSDDHQHDLDIKSIAIREFGAVDGDLLMRWLNQLTQAHGRDILRLKGIVDLAGEPRRFVFHGVHMVLDGRPGKPWEATDERMNELVFIGRDLEKMEIASGFSACKVAALTSEARVPA